jgi:hypothetical protein
VPPGSFIGFVKQAESVSVAVEDVQSAGEPAETRDAAAPAEQAMIGWLNDAPVDCLDEVVYEPKA